MKEIIEKEYIPDFNEVAVLIMMNKRTPSEYYEQEQVYVSYKNIGMGMKLVAKDDQEYDMEDYEGTIAFAFIPKKYLKEASEYSVY